MATPFSDIYNVFLSQVPDSDIMNSLQADAEETMLGYLNVAQAQLKRICKHIESVDLSDRDLVLQQYNDTLSEELVGILAFGMVWARANYRLNHSDNLTNYLNGKDRALAGSPATLINALRGYRNEAYTTFRHMAIEYSYAFSNIETLKPN